MSAAAGRHEYDPVEADIISHRLGNEQMPVMDWIEATAEYTNLDERLP